MTARVLLITERFPPDLGGVARSAERTVFQLARLGAKCDVFTWTKSLPAGQLETNVLADSTITVHHLGLFANLDFSMQHTLNVVRWLHERASFDVIWGHYLYPSGFMAVLLAKTLSIACTVSARGNDVDRLMFPPGDFARLQWTLQSADRVTAVSRDLAKKIQVMHAEAKPVVIHNTVHPETFAPRSADPTLRQQLGIYPQEKVLGFCGELRHKKGLPFLLSALQSVRSEMPACLLVIGEIRERDKRSLQEYLHDDVATRKRILVTGNIESQCEVARHLCLCDVVLAPSVWDGLPNSILEAMACERLVIASDAGGIPEIIDHQETGFLVPTAHLHRLGEAVRECLQLPADIRKKIGSAARQHVMEQFHPDREADELSVLLEGLAPNTSR